MQNDIIEAIYNRRVLGLIYKDQHRDVEPHILGSDRKGHAALQAWQLSGTRPGWRLFHIAKIQSLQPTGDFFEGRRGRPTGKQFSHIIAAVD